MRTTIDIDDIIMAEAMEATGAKSKKKAVEIALYEYVASKRRQKLADRIGIYKKFDLRQKDLGEMRDDR